MDKHKKALLLGLLFWGVCLAYGLLMPEGRQRMLRCLVGREDSPVAQAYAALIPSPGIFQVFAP